MMKITLKRAYDEMEDGDGYRILIDRLWPRGISKEELKLDTWLKDIAPSEELRKWFDHDPDKFDDFRRRYRKELNDKPDAVEKLLSLCREKETVTLVYSAKDREHNNAKVLKEYLKDY